LGFGLFVLHAGFVERPNVTGSISIGFQLLE